jgi:hypothetical protein
MRLGVLMGAVSVVLGVIPLSAAERGHAPRPTAEQVVAALTNGNRRFATGHARHPHTERAASAGGGPGLLRFPRFSRVAL